MIFSSSCQYALKSCIYLANKKNAKVGVAEIAEFISSPIQFTSKILQKLAKEDVISSSKGRLGGFFLNPQQFENLTIKDIYFAIENNSLLEGCVLGISECNEIKPCPIHFLVVEIKSQLCHILALKIKDIKDDGTIQFI